MRPRKPYKTPKRKARRIPDFQRIHAKNRLKLRYGIAIDDTEYYALCRRCNGSEEPCAVLLRKLTQTKSLYVVSLRGREFVAVYSRRTKRIVTFLPKEEGENIGREKEEVAVSGLSDV